MVQVGRLATGAVFLALFAGFELHIPAIENLIPGGYSGLAYTGYIGFGFLITGISSIAYAFSTPSRPSYPFGGRGTGGTAGAPDPATMMAAMAAMGQVQQTQGPGYGGGSVLCTACGKFSLAGATFCQSCAAPLPSVPSSAPSTGPSGPKSN